MNILKKTVLFLLLIVKLFCQLTITLVMLLYNCIFKNSSKRVIFVICFTLLFTTLFFTFNKSFAGNKMNKSNNLLTSNLTVKNDLISSNSAINAKRVEKKENKNITIDTIEKDLLNVDFISYQAVEVERKTGKPEGPFATNFATDGESVMELPPGAFAPTMPCPTLPTGLEIKGGIPGIPGIGAPAPEKKLTKAQLAKLKAEEARRNITNCLENEISLKGIVIDNKNRKTIAILEMTNPSGNRGIKSVSSKEVLWLPTCTVTVTGISKDHVTLNSGGITVKKYLEEISDDIMLNPTTAGGSGITGSTDGSLVPPPLPGASGTPGKPGTNVSSKQMSDIDKLLNSF